MKRSSFIVTCLALAALVATAPAVPPRCDGTQPLDPTAVFPELPGWNQDGAATAFVPDNLYEYIDGAAENFLAYGFEKLAVQNYANKDKQAISAEVYYHGTPENAFGIYGSEKPLAGNYIRIGAEGYEEEGVLNFISGPYYVKLNGFNLGGAGVDTLKALGTKIAQSLQGGEALPAILASFPLAGRRAHSERYIAGNFLGHDFLLPAFTAEYELQGKKFQLFIMKTGGEENSRALLRRYAALDAAKPVGEMRPGLLTVRDPYNGPVRLGWGREFIWGSLGNGAGADDLLKELGTNLTTPR